MVTDEYIYTLTDEYTSTFIYIYSFYMNKLLQVTF